MTFTQPDLRPINRKEYKLFSNWVYEWQEGLTKCRIVFRAGSVTDIASIPKPLWWIGSFQPDGLHRAGAFWHDYAYQNRGIFSIDDPMADYQEFSADGMGWVDVERTFSREECDRMFLQLMREARSGGATSSTMFYAVRVFGWLAW